MITGQYEPRQDSILINGVWSAPLLLIRTMRVPRTRVLRYATVSFQIIRCRFPTFCATVAGPEMAACGYPNRYVRVNSTPLVDRSDLNNSDGLNAGSTAEVARIFLLGPAHEAAGTRSDVIDGQTVAEVLEEAVARYGTTFREVLDVSKIWVNGEPADSSNPVAPYDEIAVLPPISGG
jgi:molybdopterin synthase sulfur carrier subunit